MVQSMQTNKYNEILNRVKEKNLISDTENVSDKIQHLFMIKALKNVEIKGSPLSLKVMLEILSSTIRQEKYIKKLQM
jgi:5-methylcytosine-specific restriction endonuclease McrBC regulatory subunit McrC